MDTRRSTATKSKTGNRGAQNSADDAPVFVFKARFNELKDQLGHTKKLYERSFENTRELRARFRTIESDLIALQFERDYRTEIIGEEISGISSEDSASQSAVKVAEKSKPKRRGSKRGSTSKRAYTKAQPSRSATAEEVELVAAEDENADDDAASPAETEAHDA